MREWLKYVVPLGLALTSVTRAETPQLFPPEFFAFRSFKHTVDELTVAAQERLTLNPPSGGAHALDILTDMMLDSDFAPGKTCDKDSDNKFTQTCKNAGSKIYDYAKRWRVESDREIPEKIEELAWLATLVYGLGGWRKGHDFRSDFFL